MQFRIKWLYINGNWNYFAVFTSNQIDEIDFRRSHSAAK